MKELYSNKSKHMSKHTCERCGKNRIKGATRSHSNIKTNKPRKANLQKGMLNGRKAVMCTKCIKTITKELAK